MGQEAAGLHDNVRDKVPAPVCPHELALYIPQQTCMCGWAPNCSTASLRTCWAAPASSAAVVSGHHPREPHQRVAATIFLNHPVVSRQGAGARGSCTNAGKNQCSLTDGSKRPLIPMSAQKCSIGVQPTVRLNGIIETARSLTTGMT